MTPEFVRSRSTRDVETIQPRQAEDVAALRETFTELRAFALEKHHHGLRDAHEKSLGVLAGTLLVHGDLPGDLRQDCSPTRVSCR